MPHGIDQGCEGSCRSRESEYTVNGEYSGILFKIIVTEAQVDTKSTTTLM
jgi:hypothetical protein